jgi:predicted site-specific integrase-resolvase
MTNDLGLRSEAEQAERLGVTTRTLRRWRRAGYGPAVVRVGRFIYYSPEAERAWLASREQSVELPPPRRRRAA